MFCWFTGLISFSALLTSSIARMPKVLLWPPSSGEAVLWPHWRSLSMTLDRTPMSTSWARAVVTSRSKLAVARIARRTARRRVSRLIFMGYLEWHRRLFLCVRLHDRGRADIDLPLRHAVPELDLG